MTEPWKIAVVWSNRSEEGIIRPVIDGLKKDSHFDVQEWKIPDDVYKVAEYVNQLEASDAELPDLAIVPYDRPPVTLMAFFLFHVHVPLVQLHAGDISSGTFDDRDRWCISLWAKYHFCASKVQSRRLRKFLRSMGREPEYVYVCGPTNLDDIDKMPEPPDGDYDVVMYNPPTARLEGINDEMGEIVTMLERPTYWLYPNGDEGSAQVKTLTDMVAAGNKNILPTPTMPHESLLALLSRAKRVIGNSSALYFEAPYFACEIIPVGERNRVRETVVPKPGASARIVRRLVRWAKETGRP